MANKISADPISQNPRDPFRPRVASPTRLTSRRQNSQVTSQSKPGAQLTPVSTGKREYRLGNIRPKTSTSDGFGQISRPYREDGARVKINYKDQVGR